MESILTSIKKLIGITEDYKHFDTDNVISTCLDTYNAIHYGNESLLITEPIERKPNDTCPWRR